MKNKHLTLRIVCLFCCLICYQSCTAYYIQNGTTRPQSVTLRYKEDNDQTKRNERRLLSAEKNGNIVDLHKNGEEKSQVSLDFKLPPNAKLELTILLSPLYYDTAFSPVICYSLTNGYGVDSLSCLNFDQLSSNAESSGIPIFLVRIKKKIFIR